MKTMIQDAYARTVLIVMMLSSDTVDVGCFLDGVLTWYSPSSTRS